MPLEGEATQAEGLTADVPTAAEGQIEFQLDESSSPPADASTPETAAGAVTVPPVPAAEPLPPWATELQSRTEAAERRATETQQRFDQLIRQAEQQRYQQQQQRPQIDRQRLATLNAKIQSGDYTATELTQFLDLRDEMRQYEAQAERAELLAIAEARSRSASSEQAARGIFNVGTMGEGFDYDSIKAKYVEPMYQASPLVREVIAQMGNPAAFEMYAGICAYIDQHPAVKGDPAKTLSTIIAALNGSAQQPAAAAHKATVTSIAEATRRGGQKILAGAQPQGGRISRAIKPEDIATMSDEEFAQLERQIGAKR